MAGRALTANTPARLRVLGASLVLLSLAWGALAGWTVSQHACAASDVVHSVARSDLDAGIGSGSRPAATLEQASIDVRQIRGDQILNLISRSGSTSFPADFTLVSGEVGPGPGTLLDVAAASGSGQAKDRLAAAASDATRLRAW